MIEVMECDVHSKDKEYTGRSKHSIFRNLQKADMGNFLQTEATSKWNRWKVVETEGVSPLSSTQNEWAGNYEDTELLSY